MSCPISQSIDRHLDYEDRALAEEEREWEEMDPNLRSLAESPEGVGLVHENCEEENE